MINIEDKGHPIDLLEWHAVMQEWYFERLSNDEIHVNRTGRQADYQISVNWLEPMNIIHCSCQFKLSINTGQLDALHLFAALANQLLWLGHFDIWEHEQAVVLRHSIVPDADGFCSTEQIERSIEQSLDYCEHYFHAFKLVAEGRIFPRQAMEMCRLNVQGEA